MAQVAQVAHVAEVAEVGREIHGGTTNDDDGSDDGYRISSAERDEIASQDTPIDDAAPGGSGRSASGGGSAAIVLGSLVEVVAGKKHVGAVGCVTGFRGATQVYLKLPDETCDVYKSRTSLQVVGRADGCAEDAGHDSVGAPRSAHGSRVEGPVTRSITREAQHACVNDTGSPGQDLRTRSKVRPMRAIPDVVAAALESKDWRVPSGLSRKPTFCGLDVVKLRTESPGVNISINYLSHLLGDRLLEVDIPYSQSAAELPVLEETFDGSRYVLISARLFDDAEKQTFPFSKAKVTRCIYVRVAALGSEELSLSDLLLSLGDFAALRPRKFVARMSLLESPSKTIKNGSKKGQRAMFHLKADAIERIPDAGYVGCGFISEELLEYFAGGGITARRAVAVQVRVFAPAFGIFKGVLCRKKILGPAQIQLPDSMRKVSRSKKSELHDVSVVAVNGMFPSSKNVVLGKMQRPPKPEWVPPRSFEDEHKRRPLGNMIEAMLEGLSVPRELLHDYEGREVSISHPKHGYLVGVSDPTGKLSPGTVLVPGLDADRIFVTRAPCLVPEDGRLFRAPEQPEVMSDEEWEWLTNWSFGAIIFANPRPGTKTTPELIAGGDLDGDLYFVMWDEAIIASLSESCVPLPTVPADEEGPPELSPSPRASEGEDWFAIAQRMILRVVREAPEISELISILYALAERSRDEGYDDQHRAFSEAFKQALDYEKQGKPIYLETDFQQHVQPSLRKYLTAPPGRSP